MELSKPRSDGDSGVRPVDRIDFDMLRAIASARQASSATVRAMHMAPVADEAPSMTGCAQTMALLRGEQAPTSGAFRAAGAATLFDNDAHFGADNGTDFGAGNRAGNGSNGNAT
jgi:hypothetical protein